MSSATEERRVGWSLAYLQTALQKQRFVERDKASVLQIKIPQQDQDWGEASEVPEEQNCRYITLRVRLAPAGPKSGASFNAAAA